METKHLASGYATDNLSADERRRLLEASLTDQELFDRMVEEESWRGVFESPGVRRELLERLERPTGWRRLLTALRTPFANPTFAVGGLAAAALVVALLPRFTDPAQVGTDPAMQPGAASVDASASDLVAKGTPSRTRGGLGDLPPDSSVASIIPELEVTYALERDTDDGPRWVIPGESVGAEERFRIRLSANVPVWAYLFNRSGDEATYAVLFPLGADDPKVEPSDLGKDTLVPGATEWFAMDSTPADESLVLVVSTRPWPAFQPKDDTVPSATLDAALAEAESTFESLPWGRFRSEDRVRVRVVDAPSEAVVVARLLEP